jgi:archaellum biogenesis ATPase FlaH
MLYYIIYGLNRTYKCQATTLPPKIIRKGDVVDFFKLVAEVGFPIAAALAAGYFVFLTLKFILQGVTGSVNGIKGIIMALDNRVKTMNHDVIRIDTLVSNALGVKPDVDRIARADGKNDARRD